MFARHSNNAEQTKKSDMSIFSYVENMSKCTYDHNTNPGINKSELGALNYATDRHHAGRKELSSIKKTTDPY